MFCIFHIYILFVYMKKRYISLGADCGVSEFLKKNNLRDCSLPFDWIVSYQGPTDIIRNNFEGFMPKDGGGRFFHKESKCWFVHYSFPEDNEKMNRRIARFTEMLEKSGEDTVIHFIRNTHWTSHHGEYNNHIKNELQTEDIPQCYECNYDELENIYGLDALLKEKYPNLKYKIFLQLLCYKCYDKNQFYHSKSNNVVITNIAYENPTNERVEETLARLFM